MDNSSDDEIELLNPPNGDEKDVDCELFEIEPSVNPLLFLRQGSSDVFCPASIHALQTAFSSLTQKLNDKTKKYNELYQKNKLMQKALLDMSQQDHMKAGNAMNDMCPLEPSIVHAAGAGCSGEDEAVIAEQRARQGYISHLEREVLRKNNLIARFTSENQRLKFTLDERDREKKGLVQENDALKTDLDRLTYSSEEEVVDRHKRIDELEDQLQTLFQEKIILQERIQTLEHTNNTKDVEIGDLKSKLAVSVKERQDLAMQFIELNRKDNEKEEELSRLKAQCNQYEIEADINRKRKVTEGMDDVDGDTDALMKAMDMIQSERNEMAKLVVQVQQQKNIIKDLLAANSGTDVVIPGNKVRSGISEQREKPLGDSMSIYHDPMPPVSSSNGLLMMNNKPSVIPEQSSSHIQREKSPLSRRQSDRSDYRSPSRQAFSTSPRLKENFITTGHMHIPEMLANEDSVSRRSPGAGSNIFDGSSSGPHLSPCISPRSHMGSPQPQLQPVYMNINSSQGSPREEKERQRQTQSPTLRMEHSQPSDAVRSVYQATSFVNNGARPKQNFYQADIRQSQNIELPVSVPGPKRLPDRMTQSAILIRDNSSTDDSAMSRSFMGSNLTIETNEPSCISPRRQEMYPLTNLEVNEQHESERDPVYKNFVRQSNNGPDYENICNIMPHSAGTRRPIEENEDSGDVHHVRGVMDVGQGQERNDDPAQIREANVREGSDVSQLKICPVCNLEYSRLSMDQFQQHVFECFDNCEETTRTLQPSAVVTEDDRNCPMCGEVFPMTIPQDNFEQHVLAHFGDGQTNERFEIVNS